MRTLRTLVRCLTLLALAASLEPAASAKEGDVVVLTTLPVTYSIGSALAENTSITVQNIPERPRPMGALVDYFAPRAEEFRKQFEAAHAVITIGKLWDHDPLFTAVRAANIRVVDIDASKPWSTTMEGVSIALEPHEDVPWAAPNQAARNPSLYFWLSPANGVRAAEIIAADFVRLAPQDREQIERNLNAYRQQLSGLKSEYEVKFAALPNVTVFALTPDFAYLTSDMGLFVDGYFLKQDVNWSSGDLGAFKSYLTDRNIKVAIHKWEPAEPIRNAIAAAKARLVVLDPIDTGITKEGKLSKDSYIELLRGNLQALHDAFSQAN